MPDSRSRKRLDTSAGGDVERYTAYPYSPTIP